MDEDASFQGFYLEESASSARNKAAFAVIVDAVNNDHGGEEQCPWSPAQLRASFLTYLRSLKDSQKRRRVPGKTEHKIVCRRQGRVREKSARRVAAIDQMDWDDAKKGRAKKGLGVEYTSSDESEVSEDESDCDRKRFVTKRLSWEGPKLRELKDLLDLMYKSSLNTHVRNFQTERVVGDSLSLRGPPPNALKWTLVSTPIATSTPVRGTR
ncbi:hypothetical protein OS493_030631 [Desmophyllum pertusum]|uniref:Uncharacterized protein n=1 Tax=Desmophyllum pertusum TaxID=174260 RepID=A0A9W9ZJW8_9CNID|nr:hypothetical protein OS493_030631 [Desmophyllum pertusum]